MLKNHNFIFLIILFSVAIAASTLFASNDVSAQTANQTVAITTTIDPITILTNELMPLLDTSAIGNLTSLTVTTNLPCDTSNVPKIKIIAGILTNTTNVIDSSSDYTNNKGPRDTCLFTDKVTNVAAKGIPAMNRVFLKNTGSTPVHIPEGVMVTLTGIFGSPPPPPPPFSPTSISNLYAWYDASDITTITKDGSNRVSQWNDKSGNGRHLTQATAGNQPLWVSASQNGKDVINFTGSRYMANTSFGSLAQPLTVVMTIKNSVNGGGDRAVFGAKSGGAYAADFYTPRNAAGNDQFYFALTSGSVSQFTETGIVGTWRQWTFIGDSSDVVRMGGVQKATGDMALNTIDDIKIGNNHLANSPLDQPVGEIIIYSKAVSGSELTALENYLKNKWGT